jgi:hypothetical protein
MPLRHNQSHSKSVSRGRWAANDDGSSRAEGNGRSGGDGQWWRKEQRGRRWRRRRRQRGGDCLEHVLARVFEPSGRTNARVLQAAEPSEGAQQRGRGQNAENKPTPLRQPCARIPNERGQLGVRRRRVCKEACAGCEQRQQTCMGSQRAGHGRSIAAAMGCVAAGCMAAVGMHSGGGRCGGGLCTARNQ